MKIRKKDGKIFAELNETIELCDYGMNDTLETYKELLLEKISRRFDEVVKKSVLREVGED